MTRENTGNVSNRKFCQQHNLNRPKVIRLCQELELDISNGLTPEVQKMILETFQDEANDGCDCETTETQIVIANPYLEGGAVDLTTFGHRLDGLESDRNQRLQAQQDLTQSIRNLAVTGYQQGVLNSQERQAELAAAYQEAAQAEVARIQREQELDAVRRQAREDARNAFLQAQNLGESSS